LKKFEVYNVYGEGLYNGFEDIEANSKEGAEAIVEAMYEEWEDGNRYYASAEEVDKFRWE